MILPFSTEFKDGTPTQFIEKIWTGIVTKHLIPTADVVEFFKTLNEFQRSLVANIDAEDLATLNPKLHTMREDEKDRWHAGMKIHMVVFNRSKNRFQFAPVLECKSVQYIRILHDNDVPYGPTVYMGDTLESLMPWYYPTYGDFEMEQLAINDGFRDSAHFFEWFNKDFTGKIIHWTDLRY